MQQKFLIPEDTVLQVTDEQGIEVDEDVFPELARKAMCVWSSPLLMVRGLKICGYVCFLQKAFTDLW